MKFWILASVALAEEVPGLNGWRVTCRVPIEKPGFALIDDGALYQEKRISQYKSNFSAKKKLQRFALYC